MHTKPICHAEPKHRENPLVFSKANFRAIVMLETCLGVTSPSENLIKQTEQLLQRANREKMING